MDASETTGADSIMNTPNLPSPGLLALQAKWLAPARARLLRRIHVARRSRVLDLACGAGAVTGELVRRSGGAVVALDREFAALAPEASDAFAGARCVCADAAGLPFVAGTFDLVLCQFALMWLDAAIVLREIDRVLSSDGVLVAMEPDYGGMIEYPPETAAKETWLAALRRAGADPEIGRRLPGMLAELGFSVRVDLLDRLEPPETARFDLLREMPLTERERERLARAEQACAQLGDGVIAHLPVFLITAAR